MQSRLLCGEGQNGQLTAVAETTAKYPTLDEFQANCHPSQHWSKYRTQSKKVKISESPLSAELAELLGPSIPQAHLDFIRKRPGACYCQYLSFKQTPMHLRDCGWTTAFGRPLPCMCVYTSRKSQERSQRSRPAVAGDQRSKGNGRSHSSGAFTRHHQWGEPAVADDRRGRSCSEWGDWTPQSRNWNCNSEWD